MGQWWRQEGLGWLAVEKKAWGERWELSFWVTAYREQRSLRERERERERKRERERIGVGF